MVGNLPTLHFAVYVSMSTDNSGIMGTQCSIEKPELTDKQL